jgi:hypothetical protein
VQSILRRDLDKSAVINEANMTPFYMILNDEGLLPDSFIPKRNEVKARLLLNSRADADTVRVMQVENKNLRQTVQAQAALIAELRAALGDV